MLFSRIPQNSHENTYSRASFLTLFRMGLFSAAHGMGGGGGGGGGVKSPPPLKFVTYPTMIKTWHNHTLPKEDPKNI